MREEEGAYQKFAVPLMTPNYKTLIYLMEEFYESISNHKYGSVVGPNVITDVNSSGSPARSHL
jgi:hypothetical protein